MSALTSPVTRRANVEALLLKAAAAQPYEEELQFVLSFYGSDFDALLLPTHLEIFSRNFQAEREVVVSDIITFFRSCTPGQFEVMSQVSKLVRLPACDASYQCYEREVIQCPAMYQEVSRLDDVSGASESFNTLAHPQEPHRKPQPCGYF